MKTTRTTMTIPMTENRSTTRPATVDAADRSSGSWTQPTPRDDDASSQLNEARALLTAALDKWRTPTRQAD
jgi:hypothetical protein